MERRELFTRLFGAQPAKVPVSREPDPVLQTPSYLNTDAATAVNKTWYDVPEEGNFDAEIDSIYGLEYRMEVIPEMFQDSALFMVYCTPAAQQGAGRISFGLAENYALFINDEIDSRQSEPDSLLGAVQLVLTVSPQPDGLAYTNLKLIDHYGMTLATLKSRKYKLTDWNGVFEPGTGLTASGDKPAGWRLRIVQINGYQNTTK